jgi:hypothetical protein
MTRLKIQTPNETLASGVTSFKLIPDTSLPNCLTDVQCEFENGGHVDWITSILCPSPHPQNNIMNLAFTGTLGQNTSSTIVHVLFPESQGFVLSSPILTGFFTFQDSSTSYNVSYYWDVITSSVNYVSLRFQRKDIVVDLNKPLLLSANINLF